MTYVAPPGGWQVPGRYGYIDKTGKFLIEPRFQFAGRFREGLAAVEVARKWGLIDKHGNEVVSPRFEKVGELSEGLAVLSVNGKWGYLDASGTMVIPAQFDSASDFSEDLAAVGVGEHVGYIDKTGRMVIPPQFYNSGNFSEGLAWAGVAKDSPSSPRQQGIMVGRNKYVYLQFGYIDKTGEWVIPPRFHAVDNFAQGLAPPGIDWRYGYIDRQGQFIIPRQFLGAKMFREGLAHAFGGRIRFPFQGEYLIAGEGYINRSGKWVIHSLYRRQFGVFFSEGMVAFHSVSGEWG